MDSKHNTLTGYIFMKYGRLEEFLKYKTLKLVDPTNTNDPFEFTPSFLDGSPFSHSEYNEAIKQLGFLSFCKEINSPAVWGHYADSHKGIALEFKFTMFGEAITRTFANNRRRYHDIEVFSGAALYPQPLGKTLTTSIFDVEYCSSNKRLPLKDKDQWEKDPNLFEPAFSKSKEDSIKNAIEEQFVALCTLKDNAWAFEKEMRMMFRIDSVEKNGGRTKLSPDGKTMYFVPGFFEHLQRIILGIRVDDAKKDEVLKLLKEHGGNEVGIVKAEKSPDKFEVVIPD